jgi:hypothetical protein
LCGNNAQKAKGLLAHSKELVNIVARDVNNITSVQFMLCVVQSQTSATMQYIDAMIMRMLIQRCMSTGLYREIAHMEMWRLLIVSDQYLACSTVRAAIFRPISTHRDILPAQLALLYAPGSMNGAHYPSYVKNQKIEMPRKPVNSPASRPTL